MQDKKMFVYVSPKTNHNVANRMCSRLPIVLKDFESIEEVFPHLSDSSFYVDFICINIEIFQQREDRLDMFDIINTLSTLLKSTVHRTADGRVKKRDTKIFVVVGQDTDVGLVKQVMNFPGIATVGWILNREEDFDSTLRHVNNMIAGDFTPHERVLELVKPKKKTASTKNSITLTVRQAQVLQIVQERGASNKTIAKMLGLSESTVKLHMGAILKKYGVKNRTQLALFSKNRYPEHTE